MDAVLAHRRRLMEMGGNNNVLYYAKDLTFDGTNYVNTGLKIMSGDDFEIVMTITPTITPTTAHRFLHCRTTSLPYYGIDLRPRSATTPYFDLVANNSDCFNTNVMMVVNVPETVRITRVGNTMTIYNGVSSNSKVVTSNNKDFVLGAIYKDDGTYTNITPFFLNEITITKL